MRPIKFRAWAKHTTDHRWEWAYSMANEKVEKQPHLENMENDFRQEFLDEWDRTHKPDERTTEKILFVYEEQARIALNGVLVTRHGYDILAIEQFTGLHDKNGREIYEGDILKASDGTPCEVRWTEVSLAFVATATAICIDPFDWKAREVIGNIHENPELLK